MQELKRVKVGTFSIEQAITLEDLQKNSNDKRYIQNNLIKIEEVFDKNDEITLDTKKLELFLNGVKLSMQKQDGIYKIYNEIHTFIGTGEIKDSKLKRDVVI